ncbi:MAG: 50S ribosomal protein L25/general stress protein Ctc [Thermotogae bacterium]|nr:50S ribosomal protein L25/general stress protein Ctc [Thermotogota bacterium]
MEHVVKAQLRDKFGRNASKKYRREGFIPVVLYGKGEKNIHAIMRKGDLMKFLHETHGESVVLTVDIDGEQYMAIVKDIQLHPVTDDVIHVDFLLLHKGEAIEIEVPVVIVNADKAPATKAGGIIELLTHTLAVKAEPQHIPAHIEIDVSNLELGDVIYVKDIKTENFTISEDPDMPVVTVLTERKEAVAAEAEGEETEETPTEGEAEGPASEQ